MVGNEEWQLERKETVRQQLSEMAVDLQLLLPTIRLQELDASALSLDGDEALFLSWAMVDLGIGRISHALFDFEQRLLPSAIRKNPTWYSCVLLWSALCRIYTCDAQAALSHVAVAESICATADLIPEIMLAKGMALRLAGYLSESMSVLQMVAKQDSGLSPWGRHQALGWLYETEAAAGLNWDAEQRCSWLAKEDKLRYHGTMGILLAALYRIQRTSEQQGEKDKVADDILAWLDNAPIFQRPLLTMLLQDILPRPLAGTKQKEQPTESAWY